MQTKRPSKAPPGHAAKVLAALLIPIAVFLSYFMLDSNIRTVAIALLVIAAAGIVGLSYKKKPQSPDLFISSGLTPPATFSQELILTKRGGKGDNFFCDPSLAFGSLSDFSFIPGRKIDFATLIREKGHVIGPYCVDDERRQIIFVETPAGFDPATEGPFYFQSQRKKAVRLYTVPYEEYHRVAKSLTSAHTDNLLLVYNTSRCGSTLLSKCLSSLTGMQSISEPDVFTSLTHMAAEARGTRNADIIAIANSSAKIICHLRRLKHPNLDAICLKFRFQQIYIADLLRQAIPDAKTIFLYRNALDVIDSMGAAFINTGAYRAIRYTGFDSFYVFYISQLPLHLWKLMPLMNDLKRFPQSVYQGLGAVCPFVMTWISVMHYALKFTQSGVIQASVRYEDMIEGKTDLIKKLLFEIGMRCETVNSSGTEDSEDSDTSVNYATPRGRSASAEGSELHFKKDVHAKTSSRSRRTKFNADGTRERLGFAYLRGNDVAHITKVISQHPTLHSDSIVTNTLSLNDVYHKSATSCA